MRSRHLCWHQAGQRIQVSEGRRGWFLQCSNCPGKSSELQSLLLLQPTHHQDLPSAHDQVRAAKLRTLVPSFLQGLSRTWHLAQISYFDGWLILASKFPECWKSFQEEGVNRFTGGSKIFNGFVLHSWICFSRVDANLLSVKTNYRTKRVRLRNTYKLWNLKILVIVKSCSSTLVSLGAFICYW